MIDPVHMTTVLSMDTTRSSDAEAAWEKVKASAFDIPLYFLEAYPRFKKWQGRRDLVFHCIRFARTSEQAFKLGCAAMNDKATLVRYRAACLLAYSLRKDAIPILRSAAQVHDEATRKDCERAIRAIEKQDHHLFMAHRADSWIVNSGDERRAEPGVFNKLKRLLQ